MQLNSFLRLAIASNLLLASNIAHADGLSDFKAAIARLQGQTPVKAVVDLKTTNVQGEGKEREENTAQGSVIVEESERGLQVVFSKDLLNRADNEARNKEKNPKAKTPTQDAIGQYNTGTLRGLLNAATNLNRSLEKAMFKSEKQDNYNGKPARLLSFQIPLDKLEEKDRKYVKEFESNIDIWIAADGTPLASRSTQNVAGRAFVVISFNSKSEEQTSYTTVGNRLVAVRKESKGSASGAGEKGESSSLITVQVQSS